MSQAADALLELRRRIDARTARVGVLGLGYVGLPLCMALARAGFPVTGIDVLAARVEDVRAGRSYVEDIPAADLAAQVHSGKLVATTDMAALGALDAVLICVPTPLRKTRDPDISFVLEAVKTVAARARPGMLVVLESTTYPGTTDEVVLPAFAARGLRAGEEIAVAFSPERIDPGNPRYGLTNTPKVVGGATPRCTELASALYRAFVETVVPVGSPRAAEMVKLLENTFRAVNIALVNELALICDKLALDVWEIVDAAGTKPFGFLKFTPGPGLGGHCIPVDPLYLSWKVRERNSTARFIELADEINARMPDHVVEKAILALNGAGKPVRGSRVLVLGVAYKRDVSDVRESPALDILRRLAELGARLSYHDPHVPAIEQEGLSLRSTALDVGAEDLVIVVTDHASVDHAAVARDARLVLDCRNACRGAAPADRAKVIKL